MERVSPQPIRNKKASRLIRVFLAIGVFACLVLFFNLDSWRKLKYDKTDGRVILTDLMHRFMAHFEGLYTPGAPGSNTGDSGFIPWMRLVPVPEPDFWLGSNKATGTPIVIAYHYRTKMPLPIVLSLRRNLRMASSYAEFGWALNCGRVDSVVTDRTLGKAIPTSPSRSSEFRVRFDKNFISNSHLDINEDFIAIQSGSECRVYKISDVTPGLQQVIKDYCGMSAQALMDRANGFT